MTGGESVREWTSQHHRLGVWLRVALAKSWRWRTAHPPGRGDSGPGVRSPQLGHAEVSASAVIIRLNQWGDAYKPQSRLPQQPVQSNMVCQPQEALMVSTSIAARQINADRLKGTHTLQFLNHKGEHS